MLTNKGVMEGTILWNGGINNEGDLSFSHHDLGLKAHICTKDTKGQKIVTELPSNQSQKHMLALKLTHPLLTRTLLSVL